MFGGVLLASRAGSRLLSSPSGSRIRKLLLSASASTSPGMVVLERDGPAAEGGGAGVLKVVLNRPPANALGRELISQLREVLDQIVKDRTARAVIFCSASERAFCAGADLKERKGMSDHEVETFVSLLRHTMSMVAKLPVPTIAAVEGAAFGGGLELMLACDLRVAGENAIMGLTETSLGIIPGAGGTQRLSRLIGVSRAKELIFSASRIGTARAAEIGLVNVMVPAGQALQKSVTLAASIAAQGPLAVRLAKEAIDLGLEVSLEEGMKHEGRCYGLTIGSQDRLEGLAAFQEKRPPRFVGK